MYNADVADLYRRAKVGAKVTVTWNRFRGIS
jgi:lipoprotein-anchoring transpeptidase ErfK/SrfK